MKFLHRFLILATVPAAHAWTPSQEPPKMPLDSFVLPEGLEITPWAASPALFNPTNIDIDHLGRVWVAEGVNYRGKAGRQPGGDRIVILEDSDGDGKSDRSQVFWQDPELVSPLGIAVFDNVVIVSQPPNLLKLTDVNRDSKFDPASGDTREVLLTGFNGRNHDHSLHSLTAGPDGKWYFNQGNTCGVFTDKSGKTFRIGGGYYKSGGGEWPVDTKAISGQKSDDGFVYVGGFTIRMNPDATHAEVVGYGYRNSYEQTINSRGYVFQNDNDDPPACRTTHVLERGNAGFFSNDGTRLWDADKRPGQDTPVAEWRQENPGTMPAGDVYGGGSPTGVAYYENGALGEKLIGTLLSCEPGRNVIFGYQPVVEGAGFKLDRTDFVTTNAEKNFDGADFTGGVRKQKAMAEDAKIKYNFRPSDICVGPDGALYVADWTDPRVGGHDTQDDAASGIIYRIAPKGFKAGVPKIDLGTVEGAVLALKSPAVNVRSLGYQKLKSSGAAAYDAVAKVLDDSNPYVASRAIWLMPYLGEKGRAKLDTLIASKDAATRLTAFRAIRRTDGAIDDLPYARKLSTDPDSGVRAEAAQAVRGRSFEEARDVLVNVALQYDGKDRSYLESFGIGAGHHTEALWKAIGQKMQPGPPAGWSDTFARLTWRLMPEAAVASLKARATASNLTEDQRKFAVDSIAFIKSKDSAEALMDLAAKGSPVREQCLWWLQNRSEGEWASFGLGADLLKRGLIEKAVPLVEMTVPLKPESTKFTVADVMALKGDAARGKVAAGRCVMCHKIDQAGPEYGPALKGFGSRQPPEVVARSMVDPSFDISHGFEGTAINLKDGKWIDGRIISDGDPVVISATGGVVQRVPKKQIAGRNKMDRSLMLNADQLGMTAQDVADIVEWMKTY
ncbi:MAG: PVC-type heme-binding CxxCH protein [Verrucomicrobiota bacterium]